MKRRSFLAAVLAVVPLTAAAEKPLDYTNGLVKDRLAAGETVFVDFTASWCTTCRAQGRVIARLREDNPIYDENITFVDVDWDRYGNERLSRELNIPRRSTLVLLRGDEELGRVVARTSQSDIQALMDLGLNADS